MPLNQLAIVVVTIVSYALLFLSVGAFYKRLFGYKEDEFMKINFAVNLTMLITLFSVCIAIALYFFKIIK